MDGCGGVEPPQGGAGNLQAPVVNISDVAASQFAYCAIKPCSHCQSKSDFSTYPIGIRLYLVSENIKNSHEIRFLKNRFKPHSYVIMWFEIFIFLEIRFSQTALIRFCVAFLPKLLSYTT